MPRALCKQMDQASAGQGPPCDTTLPDLLAGIIRRNVVRRRGLAGRWMRGARLRIMGLAAANPSVQESHRQMPQKTGQFEPERRRRVVK